MVSRLISLRGKFDVFMFRGRVPSVAMIYLRNFDLPFEFYARSDWTDCFTDTSKWALILLYSNVIIFLIIH